MKSYFRVRTAEQRDKGNYNLGYLFNESAYVFDVFVTVDCEPGGGWDRCLVPMEYLGTNDLEELRKIRVSGFDCYDMWLERVACAFGKFYSIDKKFSSLWRVQK